MYLKVNSIKNKKFKRFLEHSLYLAIVLILIPGFLFFELCIVLPTVVEEWTLTYFVHLFCATFLLVNILGNFIYGSLTDTSVNARMVHSINSNDLNVCTVCECPQPPRSWHCDICNICILKRDHHCTFLASCVGYYNHRYFILFTFYVFVAMVYALYYNVQFCAKVVSWNNGLAIAKFVFPLAGFFIDFGSESIYVFLIIINVIIALLSGFLFFYHMRNVFKGKTVPETKHNPNEYNFDRGLRGNLEEVFGKRWHLTWILPFIHSPLPGNGLEWHTDDKYK